MSGGTQTEVGAHILAPHVAAAARRIGSGIELDDVDEGYVLVAVDQLEYERSRVARKNGQTSFKVDSSTRRTMVTSTLGDLVISSRSKLSTTDDLDGSASPLKSTVDDLRAILEQDAVAANRVEYLFSSIAEQLSGVLTPAAS